MPYLPNRRCCRCGEKMRQIDLATNHQVFQVSYLTLGFTEENEQQAWRTADYCLDCQKDLRWEFYQRGLVINDKTNAELDERARKEPWNE